MKKESGIRGWPAPERPRERLFARGAHALTDAELLAILLRTGAKGQSAVELGRELIRRFGSPCDMARRLPKEYSRLAGLGAAKTAALAAAFELGRRSLSPSANPGASFRSSRDIAARFLPLCRNLKREVFRIAILDSAHRLIRARTVTVGTLNLALVHPRDVFREAIVENAAAIVLIHNHPSGDPAPSEEDHRLTRQLVSAGQALSIPVLDHLILGHDRYFSFADSRRLKS
jgi:DNA repair protein RadC